MRATGITYVQGRNSYSDADGTKFGIAIHNTSNTASAAAEASYATRRTDGVSAHFYVDGTAVIQSLDTLARAGHAGSSTGNQNAVAVEIRGVNGWSRQQWLEGVAWDLLGRTLAQVCRAYGTQVRRASAAEMKANPRVRAFYSHDDMRQAWGGTDHTDPGGNFPWDRLFSAVNAALGGEEDDLKDDERAWLKDIHDRVIYIDRRVEADAESNPTYKDPADKVVQHRGVQERKAILAAAAKPVDVTALAGALAPLLNEQGVEVGEEQLVTALASEAGQAALVKAANAAEDS